MILLSAAARPVAVRARHAAALRGDGARHAHRRRCARAPRTTRAAVSDLRARAGAVRRAGLGRALAGAAAALLAADRDQPARRAAADHQRAARRRAHRQLPQGAQLPRRPAGAAPRCRSTPADVDAELPPSQQRLADAIVRRAGERRRRGRRCRSSSSSGADAPEQAARRRHAAARARPARSTACPPTLLPAQAGELETLARLWQRESVLLPLALYLDAARQPRRAPRRPRSPPSAASWRAATACCSSTTREPWPDWAAPRWPSTSTSRRRPSSATRGQTALGERAGDGAGAARRPVQPQPVRASARDRREALAAPPRPTSDARGPPLGRLPDEHAPPRSTRWRSASSPRPTWDDLVLPDDGAEPAAPDRRPGRAARRRSTTTGASPPG